MNENNLGGIVRLIRWVLLSTFSIEFIGAALLSVRFIPELGLGEGIFQSVFHSVSAFCNAGFDLTGSSFVSYATDPLINFIIIFLITIGGLGFGVLSDIRNSRSFKTLRLHTKIVIISSAALVFIGFIFTIIFEWNNPYTLGKLSFPQKLQAALFESVTLRTAGFNTLDLSRLLDPTKLISCILMFIGAAPASTGGGIKVTTFALLVLMIKSVVTGKSDTVVLGRAVDRETTRRAMAISMIGLIVLLADVVIISAVQQGTSFIDLVFECASALGTVGVSSVGTSTLCSAARIILIVTMFIGRLGPLSIALAIAKRQANRPDSIKYPSERVMVG